MKITVNTRLLLKNRLEGIGIFTNESLKRITTWHPEHHFYFVFDRKFDEEFIFNSNITPIVLPPQARHPFLWQIYFEHSIPHYLKKNPPDLFLSPDGFLSLNTSVKQIPVIHDLNFEHHPDFLKPIVKNYYTKYFPKFAQKAERIVTVSQFSKKDIHETYNIPLEQIDVVYNGCNNHFHPINEDIKQEVKQKYSQGCDFFLFVSAIHKRKNLSNILLAFDQFKLSNSNNIKFVVVGCKAGEQGEIESIYQSLQHKDDVLFVGRLNNEELSKVTATAIALIYASLFEGFGIPIIEAFHAETAVITSNITSMPEVAGEGALIVNPHSAEEISKAMLSLYTDTKLRTEIIAKARLQREKFSWDRTANLLWDSIEKVL